MAGQNSQQAVGNGSGGLRELLIEFFADVFESP